MIKKILIALCFLISYSSNAEQVLEVHEYFKGSDTIQLKDKIRIKLDTNQGLSDYKYLFINGELASKYKISKIIHSENSIVFQIDSTGIWDKLNFTRPEFFSADISVGKSDTVRLATTASVYFKYSPSFKSLYVWPWLVIIVALLLLLIILALTNNVLKDDHNLYYSWGRVQLFYWTVLILGVYVFLWAVTDELPVPSVTVLAILGITAGTTTAANAIDNQDKKNPANNVVKGSKSEGFLLDILSDGTSINVHRFQSVAFNVAIGIVFLQKAVASHLIPDLDTNALVLLGISSATYAGLKIGEAKTDESLPTQVPNAPAPTLPQPSVLEEPTVRDPSKF